MVNEYRTGDRIEAILAVSGGADSVYLLDLYREKSYQLLVAHYNHAARGRQSDADQRFIASLCKDWGLPMEVGRTKPEATISPIVRRKGKSSPRFEEKAREIRYAFLKDLLERHKAKKVLVAHTADDQVETVLMRILEGAGISGLKGIPRTTKDGIERPLLDTWREEILAYLKKHKIPYRIDRSNLDTRFERNWIRHVLIPLLEKRYGKAVKKRIFTLGERFRELDAFVEQNARGWLEKNMEATRIPRKAYAALPSLLRIRILQILCFERIRTAPNERLLASMDKLIVSGGPSARLNVGKGVTLKCRYGEAVLSHSGKGEKTVAGSRQPKKREPVVRMESPGKYRWIAGGPAEEDVQNRSAWVFLWKDQGRILPARMRRLAEEGSWAAFDSDTVSTPLTVRPLKAGDRIRPFGLDAEKKVKEILIDRKIPREERWGRPVVCDADGKILWIPEVIRSAHAPVTPRTRRTVVLRGSRS